MSKSCLLILIDSPTAHHAREPPRVWRGCAGRAREYTVTVCISARVVAGAAVDRRAGIGAYLACSVRGSVLFISSLPCAR
eukprot:COSAG02_NODE_1885_length_10515_cov_7.148522_10_plen_80_part_00